MVGQLITDLERSISKPRLERYRPHKGSADPDLTTIVNYFWNIELAGALYCSISATEVALRNTLHNALTLRFGTPNWYDQRGVLDPRQLEEVVNAKNRIATSKRSLTPDRVVGELTFGFWVTILSRPYDARLWQGGPTTPLRHAFPAVPRGRRQRPIIHRRYNEIRSLRNRVSHHEPVFDDPKLQRRHEDILWGINWINPGLRAIIERFDRFPDVYQNTRERIEGELLVQLRSL